MSQNENACLVCGKPLVYSSVARRLTCSICHRAFESHACCEDGHFVCDSCHEKDGITAIMAYCENSSSKNPIQILTDLMAHPKIHMHGPEHHILIGAALLTAAHNAGATLDLPAALEEMKNRGSKYPGGSCGLWGCCGAAVSTGMATSILLSASPLSTIEWRHANAVTARCLGTIAARGGPRCCKRNGFTAVEEAVAYYRETLGIYPELPDTIICTHHTRNRQCLGRICPYFPGK